MMFENSAGQLRFATFVAERDMETPHCKCKATQIQLMECKLQQFQVTDLILHIDTSIRCKLKGRECQSSEERYRRKN